MRHNQYERQATSRGGTRHWSARGEADKMWARAVLARVVGGAGRSRHRLGSSAKPPLTLHESPGPFVTWRFSVVWAGLAQRTHPPYPTRGDRGQLRCGPAPEAPSGPSRGR